jgi:heme exporter protein D
MSFSEFLHMGGYAVYVWSAYAVATVVLAGNVIIPIIRRRRLLRELGDQARSSGARPQ